MKKIIKEAYFGGGCFWGLEDLFRHQPGVIGTVVGYSGGENDNPTYENHPGHAETLKITYDSQNTDFKHLLDFFFQVHDPTTLNRQGNDLGESYRSVIFFQNDIEKKVAQDMIDIVKESKRWGKPVATTLEPFVSFYEAEDYHQDYLQKHPDGYTCHFVREGGSYLFD